MTRFKMFKISTLQFAILSNEVPSNYGFNTHAELKHSKDGSAIAVNMTFSFAEADKNIMLLQVQCEFAIHPDDIKKLTAQNVVKIPKDVLDYFLAQTVGTARGILHCKTEGTPFNGMIIPPLDVTGMLKGDLEINIQ